MIREGPRAQMAPSVNQHENKQAKCSHKEGSAKQEFAIKYQGLDRLPEEMVVRRERPKPGFNARTRVFCGGQPFDTLLDTGATSSTVSEEVFDQVYDAMQQDIRAGRYVFGDPCCPIFEVMDCSHNPRTIDGLCKGHSIPVVHVVVFRVSSIKG